MNKEAKKILYQYLGKEDPVHGIFHIERVYKAYQIFIKDNSSINQETKKALEYAVLLHDLGRSNPKKGRSNDHGVESVKIIKECVRKGLLREMPKKEWVYYAIKNHPKKFDTSDKAEKNFLLIFLVMLDGTDAIGEAGINRAVAWVEKGPLFPWEEDKSRKEKIKRVKVLFNNPDKRTNKDRKKMQGNSVLEEFVYDYTFIKQIYYFLKKEGKISPAFDKEMKNRFKLSEQFVKDVLKTFSL